MQSISFPSQVLNGLGKPNGKNTLHYDVIVVGSGYGGAVAALRLAQSGKSVCVLEKGKEYLPGSFPITLSDIVKSTQIETRLSHRGDPRALYSIFASSNVAVGVGVGLGGGSLINSGILLKPDPRFFELDRWPKAFRQGIRTELDEGYRLFSKTIKAAFLPKHHQSLYKNLLYLQSAEKSSTVFKNTRMTVHFQDGVSQAGQNRKACILCGNCNSGCNEGSKESLDVSYLSLAQQLGAQIFNQVEVNFLKYENKRWLVYYNSLDGSHVFGGQHRWITASSVVLAAGAMGSTKILLKSKARGLPLSNQLGQGFSGNGALLGLGHFKTKRENPDPCLGPSITGLIDLRNQERFEDGILLENGTCPVFARRLTSVVISILSLKRSQLSSKDVSNLIQSFKGTEVYDRSVNWLAMGHDDGNGEIRLHGNRAVVHWPSFKNQRYVQRAASEMEKHSRALGADLVRFGNRFTFHPMGGCRMAETADKGVVNHLGQVFSGLSGSEVYSQLYICDASVIPHSIGSNPLWTISAIAERSMMLMNHKKNWKGCETMSKEKVSEKIFSSMDSSFLGLSFSERMTGFFSVREKSSPELGWFYGKADKTFLDFKLDIVLQVPSSREGKMFGKVGGTVQAPSLDLHPLRVLDGEIEFFEQVSDRVESFEMTYRLQLEALSGKRYRLVGKKDIATRSYFRAWKDTTTLFVTVKDEGDEAVGTGIAQIKIGDFIRQLRTLQVKSAQPSETARSEKIEAYSKLGWTFFSRIKESYGGIAASRRAMDLTKPFPALRSLRLPAVEDYFCKTDDGVQLRLSRYARKNAAPVMLIPGYGMTEFIFTHDTTEENLAEHIYSKGYDVWILNWRSSPSLPSSQSSFSLDDVAQYDYPAATKLICSVTGRPSVHAIAHCIGSKTLLMSLAARHSKQIASMIVLQVGLTPKVNSFLKLKSRSRLPDILHTLGIRSIDASGSLQDPFIYKLIDQALKLYPVPKGEECRNITCQRCNFIYGGFVLHRNLNHEAHERICKIVGQASVRAFIDMARNIRSEKVLNQRGEDTYLKSLKYLDIPITFVHSAENLLFQSETVEGTYRKVCNENGPKKYRFLSIPAYGHFDSLLGKNAHQDVFPYFSEHLNFHSET